MADYQRAVEATDQLPKGEFETASLGLFGEVGSMLAAIKKKRRGEGIFPDFDATVIEELGDTLWYLTCLASRARLTLPTLAQRVFRAMGDWDEAEAGDQFGTWADIQSATDFTSEAELSARLIVLATRAGELVADLSSGTLESNRDLLSGRLVAIFRALIAVAEGGDIDLDRAARENLLKIRSRWPSNPTYPPLSDQDLPWHEQLPRRFEMYIEEHNIGGKTYVTQSCDGIIIGDRLTDNKAEKDDYRFHDVFHIAYAVHLGWSPVLRALFRVKRKSCPDLDENEDGARALIVEEGVSTFVFGVAQPSLFDGVEKVDYSLLKMIQVLVHGYEPHTGALWQWERAILDGFKVFRALKKHRRGFVVADLEKHTLVFRPAEEPGHPARA